MGTLGGHLLPGTFFIFFAIWWGFITSYRYFQSKQKYPIKRNRQTGYKSSVAMPCLCIPRFRFAPVESYVKLVLAFIALVAEFYTGLKYRMHRRSELLSEQTNSTLMPEHYHHHNKKRSSEMYGQWHFEKGNAQHITMYSAFIFGSIIEILMHYGVDLPKRLDYVMGIVAFSVEAFLFAFHLHGREPIDVYIHVLLVYAILGCILFCILEAYNPRQILFTYGRILFTLLQGTWFYQVGFMLYPPTDSPAWKWDLNDHHSIMIITIVYCWHFMLIILALLIQFWFVKRAFFKTNLNLKLGDRILFDKVNNDIAYNEMSMLKLDSNSDASLDEETTFDLRLNK